MCWLTTWLSFVTDLSSIGACLFFFCCLAERGRAEQDSGSTGAGLSTVATSIQTRDPGRWIRHAQQQREPVGS